MDYFLDSVKGWKSSCKRREVRLVNGDLRENNNWGSHWESLIIWMVLVGRVVNEVLGRDSVGG